eukprot:6213745-Pleurochrysis_carterae.AAC.4
MICCPTRRRFEPDDKIALAVVSGTGKKQACIRPGREVRRRCHRPLGWRCRRLGPLGSAKPAGLSR